VEDIVYGYKGRKDDLNSKHKKRKHEIQGQEQSGTDEWSRVKPAETMDCFVQLPFI